MLGPPHSRVGIKRYDKRRKIRERAEGRQVARALRHSA